MSDTPSGVVYRFKRIGDDLYRVRFEEDGHVIEVRGDEHFDHNGYAGEIASGSTTPRIVTRHDGIYNDDTVWD